MQLFYYITNIKLKCSHKIGFIEKFIWQILEGHESRKQMLTSSLESN